MKFRLISFDLQGTLTSTAFSDEFWLKVLPRLYACGCQQPLPAAQELLRCEFRRYGRYDYRYYDARYWLRRAGLAADPPMFFDECQARPLFFKQWLPALETLSRQAELIIVSATTHDFIDYELGEARRYFSRVYSALEDFGMAGKPASVFSAVAEKHNVSPAAALHIGDDPEFDVLNASAAGFNVRRCQTNQPSLIVNFHNTESAEQG